MTIRTRNSKQQAEKNKKECLKCGVEKDTTKNFYMSNSPNHTDSRYPICKKCILDSLKVNENTDHYSNEFIETFQNTLLEMNRPFIYTLYESSVEESKSTGRELFGMYIKNVLLNFKTLTWKDSEFNKSEEINEISNANIDVEIIDNKHDVELDNRNRDDVLRMLGYDPFEYEPKEDRRHLYNKLVDFLDEGTLEDGLKLQSVIEIVKGFNQVDKINLAITQITNDIANLSKNTGGIKSLIGSKKDILASIMKLAEENGISVKHNNQKSKGAGTLSGIIKQLQEKGIEQADINLFDIETAQGMKQVADLSNKSIVAQLQFDENDYTQMIVEQREMIQDFDNKVIKLEEENRKLKKEIMKYKNEITGGDSPNE